MLDGLDSVTEVLSSVEGVKIVPFSMELVASVFATLLVGMVAIGGLLRLLDKMMSKSVKLHSIHSYVRSSVRIGLWFFLILILADMVGIPVTSVLALLGVAGLAVSLALQNTLSNLAGGLQVLVAKPFVVGDYIDTDTDSGTVTEIGLAYSKLTTVDNKEVLVPNHTIASSKIVNYTANGKRRVDLTFSAAYDIPTKRVKQAIFSVIDSLPEICQDPAPEVYLSEFGESAIRYVSRVWVETEHYWSVYFAMMEGVREAFDADNIEMPLPYLNVRMVDKD